VCGCETVTDFQLLSTENKSGARLQCPRARVCFPGLFPRRDEDGGNVS